MKLTLLLFAVILVSLQIFTIDATGQGIIGLHVITDRYVLVTDANFISLIVVDMLLGGIAGIMTFPTSMYNKKTKYDIHFVGITSCDDCLYIHVDKLHWMFKGSTQDHLLEIGPLDKPLLQMAKENDFSSFTALTFEKDAKPVWPFPKKYLTGESDTRMIRTHPSGGVGFFARQDFGILRYKLDSTGKMIEGGGDLFLKRKHEQITGVNFSSSLKYLTISGETKVYIIDVTKAGYPEYAPIDEENMTILELNKLCYEAKYRNAALWDNDDPDTPQFMYVDGHSGGTVNGGHAPVLQRITDEGGKWGNCEVIAGERDIPEGWRDGCGSGVRFTRPHDVMISPGNKKLVVTDIDNRSIRVVEPTGALSNDKACVSTISYDEGLYDKLFSESSSNMDSKILSPSAKKNKSKNKDTTKREPYILESSASEGISFSASKSLCQLSSERENSDLCTLEELRQLFLDDDSLKVDSLATPFWTKMSCRGCWKRHRGVCQEEDPQWDNDYYMVTRGINLDSSSPDERGLKTECLHEEVTKTPDLKSIVSTFCCGDVSDAQKEKADKSDKTEEKEEESTDKQEKAETEARQTEKEKNWSPTWFGMVLMSAVSSVGAIGIMKFINSRVSKKDIKYKQVKEEKDLEEEAQCAFA